MGEHGVGDPQASLEGEEVGNHRDKIIGPAIDDHAGRPTGACGHDHVQNAVTVHIPDGGANTAGESWERRDRREQAARERVIDLDITPSLIRADDH